MPADSTRNTLLRQWALLKMLPTSGSGMLVKALTEELQREGYTVSKRQVERDLKGLVECLPLECNDKGVPHGWRWSSTASINLPGMTLAEALSMRVVEDTLRPLLPASVLKTMAPRFRQAANTLSALADSNRNARWVGKVRTVAPMLPLLPPEIEPDVLETVQDALLADEQVEVAYRSMGQEQTHTLTLNPLGLVQRGPVSYLVATAHSYPDVRLYAVHRIHSAKRLYKPMEPRPDFDLDAYIQAGALQFGGGEPILMEARIKDWLARILEETPLSPDQTLEHDEHRVSATVLNTPQLRWWILSQGAAIEVIAPPELRKAIAVTLAEASGIYSKPA